MNKIEHSLPLELAYLTRSFRTHRLRPAAERERTKANIDEAPVDLLDQEIHKMHTRIVDIGVLEGDLIPGREAFYRLPFLYLPASAKAFQVRVSQYAGASSSASETTQNTSLMREVDNYIHDRNVPPTHYPNFRELHKAIYAFNQGRLAKNTQATQRFPINFEQAAAMLPHLEFVPGESLIDLAYEQKFDQFAELMNGRNLPFAITKPAFRKWIKAKTEPNIPTRLYENFSLHIDHSIDQITNNFRSNFQKYLETQSTLQK